MQEIPDNHLNEILVNVSVHLRTSDTNVFDVAINLLAKNKIPLYIFSLLEGCSLIVLLRGIPPSYTTESAISELDSREFK